MPRAINRIINEKNPIAREKVTTPIITASTKLTSGQKKKDLVSFSGYSIIYATIAKKSCTDSEFLYFSRPRSDAPQQTIIVNHATGKKQRKSQLQESDLYFVIQRPSLIYGLNQNN